MLQELIYILVSLLICRIILFYFPLISKKLNFVDIPNERSLHDTPVPRAAGISFVVSSIFYSIIKLDPLFLISLPLSIVGLMDDKKGISAIIRYGFQLATVILYFLYAKFSLQFDSFILTSIPFGLLIFFVVGLTGLINFVNFMDGSDGLIASIMAIIFFVSGILVSPLFFILSMFLVLFLSYNFPPAKYFMGDVGSMFLGSAYISALILSKNISIFCALIIISLPIIIDPTITIFRRLLLRKNIFLAHKSHLYQRLYLAGFSKKEILKIYIIPTVLLSLIYFVTNLKILILSSIFLVIYGYYYERKADKLIL